MLRRDAALRIGAMQEHGGVVRAVVRTSGLIVNRHPVEQWVGLEQHVLRVLIAS